MRVIAGSAKGRMLFGARGMKARPITDNVKKSMFDILTPWLTGARCLDLFAGTGAIGIEALSRGAEWAVFIERDPRMVGVIKRNLEVTGFAPRARVLCGDVRWVVRVLARRGEVFDLVFMDPPYGHGLAPVTLGLVCQSKILGENGTIVARHEHKQEMPGSCANVNLVRQEVYGDTVVSFYRPGGGGEHQETGGD
ncbi:MAG: 16S rRNA (guanine(966)-N(2))-methyltransferase RsmD [Bacillota bacterium]